MQEQIDSLTNRQNEIEEEIENTKTLLKIQRKELNLIKKAKKVLNTYQENQESEINDTSNFPQQSPLEPISV